MALDTPQQNSIDDPSAAAGPQIQTQNATIDGQLQSAAPVSSGSVAPAQPPLAATSANKGLHRFIGSVLGAIAGDAPARYVTDANGRIVALPAAPESASDKIRRISDHALVGLASSSSVPRQGSGLASALAGAGAGVNAVSQQQQALDRAARQKANEDFDAEQKTKLHQANIGHLNALTISTYFANEKLGNDLNPLYADNKQTASELKDANVPVQYMNVDQLKEMAQKDHNFLFSHAVLELGRAPVTDSDGNPVLDANGMPKMVGQVAVVNGLHDGKYPLTATILDDFKKYAPYGGKPIHGDVDSLQPGVDLTKEQFINVMAAIQSGEKAVLKGQVEAEDAFGGPDGKTPGKLNKVTGEFTPNPTGALTTKQLEAQANANAPSKTGAVTDADRYKEQQANYRAELGKKTAQADSMGKQGATELQKQADDYSKFLFTANSAKTSIQNAKNGDELANSLGPLQTALLVTSANGVHRINMTEVEAAGPKVGSLARRVDAALEKTGKGKLPADTLKEMSTLVDLYTKSKYTAYVKNAAYTAKLRGMDPDDTPIMDRNGNITSLSDATKGMGAGLPPAPAGKVAVQIPGSPVGFIPQESLSQFKKDHPNAVIGE